MRALLCAFVWNLAPAAYGFGASAHLIAGNIAERHMCPAALDAFSALSPGMNVAEAGLWADKIRSNPAYDYAKPLHYINIPDGVPLSAARRPVSGDVLSAIATYHGRLGDASLPADQRREALLFLTHFVVDIHQPLHVGRQEDRGGNSVKVRVNDESTNLHAYWDTGVLKGRVDSLYAYAARLDAANYRSVSLWQASGPEVWLTESQALRPEVYSFTPGAEGAAALLDEAYQQRAGEIVDVRLAQAGVRLAGVLNGLWCSAAPEK